MSTSKSALMKPIIESTITKILDQFLPCQSALATKTKKIPMPVTIRPPITRDPRISGTIASSIGFVSAEYCRSSSTPTEVTIEPPITPPRNNTIPIRIMITAPM